MPLHALLINANERQNQSSSVKFHIIEGNSSELPFANECLDLLILPHVLEFSSDPHQILREAERVLRPEGRLIISGCMIAWQPAKITVLRILLRTARTGLRL